VKGWGILWVEEVQLGRNWENHLHLVLFIVLIEMILPLPSPLLVLVPVGSCLRVFLAAGTQVIIITCGALVPRPRKIRSSTVG